MDDLAAVEAFVHEHARYLLGLARLLTRSEAEAEELVQDTMLTVVRKWNRFDTAQNARAYARRTMVNTQLSGLRRRRLQLVSLADDTPEPSHSDLSDSVLSRDELTAALATLAPTQRTAIVLHYYLDMTAADIARELRLKPSSVRASISRGLEKLRDQIGREVHQEQP